MHHELNGREIEMNCLEGGYRLLVCGCSACAHATRILYRPADARLFVCEKSLLTESPDVDTCRRWNEYHSDAPHCALNGHGIELF